MSNQLCIPNGETCVDCAEYAAAFSCLPKVKISEMNQLSELDIISILDGKCEDILIPVSSINCETGAESHSMSLKDLLKITEHTSVGERQSFPDKVFTAEGQVEEYELSLFNPSETRYMQVSYFAQWSSSIKVQSGYTILIDSNIYIDGEQIIDTDTKEKLRGGYDTYTKFISQEENASYHHDAGSMPFFYTAIIPPKTETKIKMELSCDSFTEGAYAIAETIQLMITGTTK